MNCIAIQIWFWQVPRYLRDGWTINYWPRTLGDPIGNLFAVVFDIRPLAVRGI